jgi:pentose-5-phosphate-3-epimerase
MASILELFGDKGPKTSQINKKLDKTPISVDGGVNLSTEPKLKKARGGQLNSKFYSDTIVNK